jgi:hypothetical protein
MRPGGLVYAVFDRYADASCTQRVATTGPCSGLPSAALVLHRDDPCRTTFTFSEVNEEESTLYGAMSGACMPLEHAGEEIFSLGADIPLTDLPEVADVLLGTGALRARYRSDGTGDALLPAGFTLADGTACNPERLADGKLHCLPSSSVLSIGGTDEYFADSACTHEIVDLGSGGATCPAPTLPSVAVAIESSGCGTDEVTAIYDVVGLSATVDAYGWDSMHVCQPVGHIDGEAYAEIGKALDPFNFPEITAVTE